MRNFGRLKNNYSADINSCRRLLPIKEKPSKRPKLPSLLEPPKIKNSILSSVCAPPERKWTTSTPSSASEKHPNPTLPSSGPSQKHRPNSSWTNHPFKKAKRTANAHQIQTKIQAKTVNLHSRVDHPKKVRRNRCYWRWRLFLGIKSWTFPQWTLKWEIQTEPPTWTQSGSTARNWKTPSSTSKNHRIRNYQRTSRVPKYCSRSMRNLFPPKGPISPLSW